MKKWFYVLELEGGNFYVGITGDIEGRVRQHRDGVGALWTKVHKPVRVLFTHGHEIADEEAALRLEDLMTVEMMVQHGMAKVRGGHYCAVDPDLNEAPLRAHGHYDRIRQTSLAGQACVEDWDAAAVALLDLAHEFQRQDCPNAMGDRVLLHLLAMKAHRHWAPEFDPALNEVFWGRKGLLAVILGFKLNRVLGYRLTDNFAVLANALQRGRGGDCPWSHLFLAAWDAFTPSANDAQIAKVESLRVKHAASTRDRQYDPFASVLFPELRWRLLQGDCEEYSVNVAWR